MLSAEFPVPANNFLNTPLNEKWTALLPGQIFWTCEGLIELGSEPVWTDIFKACCDGLLNFQNWNGVLLINDDCQKLKSLLIEKPKWWTNYTDH